MSDKKIAVFPGSFDPVTLGHIDIIQRALTLFDEVNIAIGLNNSKKILFPLEKRKQWIADSFLGKSNISVSSYSGLTVDYCKKIGAKYIIRGIRNINDFEYEKSIAQMNAALSTEIETIFLMTSPEYAAISSSIVRDIYQNEGDISQFVPFQIKK